MSSPPQAPQRPHVHEIHQDKRSDPYDWLKEKSDPAVLDYLREENRYFEEQMAPLKPLEETLYRDMVRHMPQVEETPPAPDGPYYYYSRIDGGNQYRTYYRRRAGSRRDLEGAPEEVVLDVNRLADDGYLDVTSVLISPDHNAMIYLENRDGTDRYTLHIVSIADQTPLSDPVSDVYIDASAAFGADGETIYYVRIDAAQRPYQLWRLHLDTQTETLLYQEDDPAFSLHLSRALSGHYLFLTASSKSSREVRFLRSDRPDAPLTLFQARRPDLLYSLEYWRGQFLILSNADGPNFALSAVPEENPDPASSRLLVPHDPTRYLRGLLPFEKAVVVAGRSGGLSAVWLFRDGKLRPLAWDEAIYSVTPHFNRDHRASEVLIRYQSLTTPPTDYAVDLLSGNRGILRQDSIADFDPSDYETRQLWAEAADGTQVPISLVGRRDTLAQGSAPLLLYGYGSYGATVEPAFDPYRLALLERGVLFAIAHVRGGSEMGYPWYLNGKLLTKRNTFTDFISAAEHLIAAGYTDAQHLAIQGRSAGGLLMGAVLNMRPDLFAVASAGVPFVDVVTTMLDASIPLTAGEWDEWGNPADPEYYWYMKSYSPYDNVAAQDYPHLYVTAGLNDPRVGYFEPAKWVAKLRDTKRDQNDLVFYTHLGSGHFGSSGRLARIRERAREYAFILAKLGLGR